MLLSWPHSRRIGSILHHIIPMGTATQRRMSIVLCIAPMGTVAQRIGSKEQSSSFFVRQFPLELCDVIWSQFFYCAAWEKNITSLASTYIVFSLPDLITQAFLHPLRIYLRTQTLHRSYHGVQQLLFFHVPLNFLLVLYVNMGFRGVSLAAVCTNFNMVLALI
jgi:hypothetical protein